MGERRERPGRRNTWAVLQRHVAICALRALGLSMTDIARMVGYRDHTTVVHHAGGQCKCLAGAEWMLCPRCQGTGRVRVDGQTLPGLLLGIWAVQANARERRAS